MNPDGTSDKNLYEFYGPQHNNTICDMSDKDLSPPTAEYTGIVKCTSKVDGVTIFLGEVICAKETGADVNNGAKNLIIKAKLWIANNSNYIFSNKGGSTNNLFSGLIRGQSKECEFFQDNWSDQSHLPSSSILDLRPEDGKIPIRIRYLYNKPKLMENSGPYKFLFPQPWIPLPRSWLARIFNQLRRWGIF